MTSEVFSKIWHYELYQVGEGSAIEVSEVVLSILVLLTGILLSLLLSRFIGRRLVGRRMNATAAAIAEKVIRYLLIIGIFFTVLRILELPLTMFAFLGGAIAIGVGFGTQNILNNFISGWILMVERPVRIDDLVELDGHIGRIQAIGARSTRIRRSDGIDLLVPNSAMLERIVTNWTLSDKNVRTNVRVGVAYGSPTEDVAKLIRKAVDEHDRIHQDPEPEVIFEDFGDNALVFDVFYWCTVEREMELRKIRSDIRFRIDALFREAGITIAFPQRDVHLDTTRPLEVRVSREEKAD